MTAPTTAERNGAALGALPALLRDEPALSALLGTGAAHVAVPEAARALFTAGVASLTQRHPVVVATPTATDAQRLANDLRVYLGPEAVDSFPAWETLPFERVSPNVETMGRRLRTMWRLREPSRSPRVLVAPVRALVQRLIPIAKKLEQTASAGLPAKDLAVAKRALGRMYDNLVGKR